MHMLVLNLTITLTCKEASTCPHSELYLRPPAPRMSEFLHSVRAGGMFGYFKSNRDLTDSEAADKLRFAYAHVTPRMAFPATDRHRP